MRFYGDIILSENKRQKRGIFMQKSKKTDLMKLCFAAMFAALICIGTVLIVIPVMGGGFVNFGDCFILVAAWTLGPYYGFAAGAIGSALADLFVGYAMYAPATFFIKGLIALTAAFAAHAISASSNRKLGYIIGATLGELVMIAGYYLYNATVMGYGFIGAALTLHYDAIQAVAGATMGCLLIAILEKTVLKKQFKNTKQKT